MDSLSIKSNLSEMGINIRYIYLIYEKTSLPYVREMILAEALARTIKKKFRETIKDLYSENILVKKK